MRRVQLIMGLALTSLLLSACTSGKPDPAATASAPAASTTTAAATLAPASTSVTFTPAAPPPPPVTPAPAADTEVLGPTGWQALTLGMSPAAAADTGIFVDTPDVAGPCQTWDAVGAAAIGRAVFTPERGLVAIVADEAKVLRTQEGLALGSTRPEVAAAFPAAPTTEADVALPVPAHPEAAYRITLDSGDKVTELRLELTGQPCGNG